MSDDEVAWREQAGERWGRAFAKLDAMHDDITEIKAQARLTNGRVTDLEKVNERHSWLIKLLGAIGLGGAAKAFIG